MIEAESSQVLPEYISEHMNASVPAPSQQIPTYALDSLSIESDTVGDALFKLELLQNSLNLSSSQEKTLSEFIEEIKKFSENSNLKDILGHTQSHFFPLDSSS